MIKGIVPDLMRQKLGQAVARSRVLRMSAVGGRRSAYRDLFVSMLQALLPTTCAIQQGTIVDSSGNSFDTWSPLGTSEEEDDVLIVDLKNIPPLLIDRSQRRAIVPIESVLARIEVRQTVVASELEAAIHNIRRFRQLGSSLRKDALVNSAAPSTVFVFETDLTAEKSEFDFLREAILTTAWEAEKPPMVGFCVVGRGTWMHLSVQGDVGRWMFCPATPDNNEVLAFVGMLMTSLPQIRLQRAGASLGAYVVDPADFRTC